MWILEELKKRSGSDRIAVIHRDRKITFEELWIASENLASKLNNELSTDQPIIVYGNKDIEIIIVMIAALKTGRAYVPIDVTFPPDRVRKIAEITEAELIFNFSSLEASFIGENQPYRIAGGFDFADYLYEPQNTLSEGSWVQSEDDCYILFTSGSTGEPKGVRISKGNILNFTNCFMRCLEVPEGSVALNQVSYSFDVSDVQLYLHLANGVTLFNIDRAMIDNFGEMFDLLRQSGVSSWASTPAFMEMCTVYDEFNSDMLPLGKILLAGEVLTKKLVRTLWQKFPSASIINGYGPSEITVLTSACEITEEMMSDEDSLPIGRVLDDASYRIEKNGHEVSKECVHGELIVVSDSVSKGYYKDDERTRESFFIQDGRRGFKTKDLVYRKGDLLYFVGRKDFQVKLNGYRIELEDVSSNLNKIDIVENSIVIPVYEDGKAVYLAAFLTLARNDFDSPSSAGIVIRKRLKALVPSYMVPRKIIILDRFPVNQNGKIDRKELASKYL